MEMLILDVTLHFEPLKASFLFVVVVLGSLFLFWGVFPPRPPQWPGIPLPPQQNSIPVKVPKTGNSSMQRLMGHRREGEERSRRPGITCSSIKATNMRVLACFRVVLFADSPAAEPKNRRL